KMNRRIIKSGLMRPRTIFLCFTLLVTVLVQGQKKGQETGYPDSIRAVGVIKNLSYSALLDLVQRQTFRYFWQFAHPVSGLARERSNTIRADYFWDYANEAYDEPNFSKGEYGPETCAIGGTGFGIMATIVAAE